MPSNFKTYESQARLLAAVIAASPDLKLNFKAIVKHYGSDATVSAMEHRFRPIKKQAAVIRAAVSQGRDAKDLEDIINMNEKEIAKYYGESTPAGIEFQFRSIKKDAKTLKETHEAGGNTTTALTGKGPSTPASKRKASAGGATKSGGGSTAKRAKKTPVRVKVSDSDAKSDGEVDYDKLDGPDVVSTPSKPPRKEVMKEPKQPQQQLPQLTYEQTPENEATAETPTGTGVGAGAVTAGMGLYQTHSFMPSDDADPPMVKLEQDALFASQDLDGGEAAFENNDYLPAYLANDVDDDGEI